MPRIDFYVLPDYTPDGRLILTCRLAEKAYGLGHRVYIHTRSPEQAQELDDLLWTFRQNSFVPHTLLPFQEDDPAPVFIGWEDQPGVQAEVLINLTHEVPVFFQRFERVAELVDQEPQTLAKSRERFRYYRDQGFTPSSHRL